MSLDFSRCRSVRLADGSLSPVKEHAKVGAAAIVSHPYFALFDEMGGMKTAQSIIGAQFLFEQRVINRAIVVAPATVRDVWYHPTYGELARHLWQGLPCRITEYHSRRRYWTWSEQKEPIFRWIVTNYEFIRREPHLIELLKYVDAKTLLILDESSAVKSYKALQTKACMELRKRAGRIVLLNGTPIAHSPLDMLSQGNLMHHSILECKGVTAFRARYCVMGGYVAKMPWGNQPTQVLKWIHLDDLQRRFAPYVLRRLKSECLGLPEKLPPITLTVPLRPTTWKIYQQMKKDMVAWLESGVATASQAMVKAMRLAQITSGFLGGIEGMLEYEPATDVDREWLSQLMEPDAPSGPVAPVQIISQEKIDFFVDWLQVRLDENPNFRILVWCRFREEVMRLMSAVHAVVAPMSVGILVGQQKTADRDRVLRLLDPRTAPKDGPIVVIGTASTGSMGLNLTAAFCVFYFSNDTSLKTRKQSEDRAHRPGQVRAVSYFDLVATGPKGQQTIDIKNLEALRDRHELAEWTTSAWLQWAKETEDDNDDE